MICSELIESFVRLALNEAMKSPEDAKSSGYALIRNGSGVNTSYILYDAKYVLRLAKQILDENNADDLDSLIAKLKSDNLIIGVIKISKGFNPCHSAWSVDMSAAKSGYGPLMYDIALSEHDVIPDRVGVSDDAGAVWEKYYKSRKDVEHKKLDDVKNPKTPQPEDDCQVYNHSDRFWLDYAYEAKSKINTSGLYQMHRTFLTALRNMFRVMGLEKNFKKESIEKAISEAAFLFAIDKLASQ